MMNQSLNHPFPPVFDESAEILILGTFPSVKSRQQLFYYGHPQNRFWPLLAAIYKVPCPVTTAEKQAFLHDHKIALWDVLASCTIQNSADSSIQNPVANDIERVLAQAPIKSIFCNGKKAKALFDRHLKERCGREALCLPSTSPANAAASFDRLLDTWQIIRESQK